MGWELALSCYKGQEISLFKGLFIAVMSILTFSYLECKEVSAGLEVVKVCYNLKSKIIDAATERCFFGGALSHYYL